MDTYFSSEEQSNRMQCKNTKEAFQAYVKTNLKHAEDLAPCLFALTISAPELMMPQEPGPNPSRTAEMIYTEKVKQYVKRESTLVSNMATIHSVAWGQCSKAMKARLKSLDRYQAKADADNCLWLLESISAITLVLDKKTNGIMSLLDARCNTLTCCQAPDQSIYVFKESLKGWADAIRFHGCAVAEKISSVPLQDASGNEWTVAQREEIAMEKTLAMMMIRGTDPTTYGTLIAELFNQFVKGKDKCPEDMASAATMLELYKPPVNQPARH